MVPDKFNMVDMGGIDLIMMQGEEVPGLYSRLVESIARCRYQCLYNWLFDGVIIPPTYVELRIGDEDEVIINEGVTVTDNDVIHIYSTEPPPDPEIIPLLAEENGVYNVPAGKDGFNPVTVDVPSYTPVIRALSVAQNGIYNPPTGVDGYAPITVNVESEPFEYSIISSASTINFGFGENRSGLIRMTIPAEVALIESMIARYDSYSYQWYNEENIKGAYSGILSESLIPFQKARFYISRYSNQNTTLVVTIEYYDGTDWIEISDHNIGPSTPYPINYIEIGIPTGARGIRWIHKKNPVKSNGNNISFFGMALI